MRAWEGGEEAWVIEVKKEAKNVMQRYDIRPMLMTNKETYLCLSDIDFVVFIIFF
jgi:hypothetical protein